MCGIALFLTNLLFFSLFFKSVHTNQVLVYFIPDLALTLMNCYITFSKNQTKVKCFVSHFFVKITIALGYYINIASAVFYLVLFLDYKYLHTGVLASQELLWL